MSLFVNGTQGIYITENQDFQFLSWQRGYFQEGDTQGFQRPPQSSAGTKQQDWLGTKHTLHSGPARWRKSYLTKDIPAKEIKKKPHSPTDTGESIRDFVVSFSQERTCLCLVFPPKDAKIRCYLQYKCLHLRAPTCLTIPMEKSQTVTVSCPLIKSINLLSENCNEQTYWAM